MGTDTTVDTGEDVAFFFRLLALFRDYRLNCDQLWVRRQEKNPFTLAMNDKNVLVPHPAPTPTPVFPTLIGAVEEPLRTFVDCSDLFMYATADTEPITPATIQMFEQTTIDVSRAYAYQDFTQHPPLASLDYDITRVVVELYVCRNRKRNLNLSTTRPSVTRIWPTLADQTVREMFLTASTYESEKQPERTNVPSSPIRENPLQRSTTAMRCCDNPHHRAVDPTDPVVCATVRDVVKLLWDMGELWDGTFFRVTADNHLIGTLAPDIYGYHTASPASTQTWDIPFCEIGEYYRCAKTGWELLKEADFPEPSETIMVMLIQSQQIFEPDMKEYSFDSYVTEQLRVQDARQFLTQQPQMRPYIRFLRKNENLP